MTLELRIFRNLFWCVAMIPSVFSWANDKAKSSIHIETYRSENIIPLLTLLNEWTLREFAQYPYLFVPPKDQVIFPSDVTLVNSKDSMVVLAKKEGTVAGMAAFISFDSPVLHTTYLTYLSNLVLLDKFNELGFDPSRILYVDYFLTAPQWRNDAAIVNAVYDQIKDFAREKGKTQICFIMDVSQPKHSSAQSKISIEPWEDVIGDFQSTGFRNVLAWPTLTEEGFAQEMEHTLEFFLKDLEER